MSAMSDYLESALINHVFRGTAFTAPANTYIALFTATPGDPGGGTEVTGGAYARQAVSNVAGSWTAPAGGNGATDNVNTLTFATATAAWGTVTSIGLFDATTAGNLLMWGALQSSKTVDSGDTFKINAGDLDITFA